MSLLKLSAVVLVAFCAVTLAADPNDRLHSHLGGDEEHVTSEGDHNPDFDHEAFAGSENQEFSQLPPEQAKEKLRIMAMKVDVDGNGRVTKAELTTWIVKQMKRYVEDDADQQWKNLNFNEDELVSWAEYKNGTYGSMSEDGAEGEEDQSFSDLLTRDRRRYDHADINNDGVLSRVEFSSFLHPEEDEHMRPLVVEETLSDLDRNKDGFLTLEEYIGEVHKEEDGSEPEWVQGEREQFNEHRDLNKDGKMDKDEVAKWILPHEDGHADEEAAHLMTSADTNKDEELTIDEIVDNHDVFVGSQATNYGSLLHEEL